MRRTQEQRRAETRAKLLDATVQSLLEVGYAATTTRRVAELAGVSSGAQTHHFPHRVDLVGAAVERLAEQRIAALKAVEVEDTAALLDLLWADYASDLFAIFVKLWVAAADDPELYTRLVPLERAMTREIAAHIPADLRGRATVVLAAMRGLALSQAYEPTGRRRADPWPAVRPILEDLLLG